MSDNSLAIPANRSGSGGSALRRPSTAIPVGAQTFAALQMAQDATDWAQAATPFGSPNQVTLFRNDRNGNPTKGEGLTRSQKAARVGLPRERLDDIDSAALLAAGALAYGAAMCRGLAALAFAYLFHQAPRGALPSLTLKIVEQTLLLERPQTQRLRHVQLEISWAGSDGPVICNPWPTRPQAVRESECAAERRNQERSLATRFGREAVTHPWFREALEAPKTTLVSHTLRDDDHGRDIIRRALVRYPRHAELIRPGEPIAPPSETQVQRFHQSIVAPAHLEFSVAAHLEPAVVYLHGNQTLRRKPVLDGPAKPV
jgi:hypothetical protein